MTQYYRMYAYYRPGVTTVSVVAPGDDDKWRSKTFQRYTSPRSASEVGASSRPGLWLLGLSWAGSLGTATYEVLYPAANSQCRWPYKSAASGSTPAPESNYEMEAA